MYGVILDGHHESPEGSQITADRIRKQLPRLLTHGQIDEREQPGHHCVMIDEMTAHPGSVSPQAVRYGYRPSAAGATWQFELDDGGLHWQIGRRRGIVNYRDVTRVVMSYRPTSMQAERYRMNIRTSKGLRLPVLSATAMGPALVEPQNAAYRSFVLELHRRLAAADSVANFRAGLSSSVFTVALVAATLVVGAMVALLIRAVLIGSWGGAFFMIGFGALFVWQVGGFLRRNWPRSYSASQPPFQMLPRETDVAAPMSFVRRLLQR